MLYTDLQMRSCVDSTKVLFSTAQFLCAICHSITGGITGIRSFLGVSMPGSRSLQGSGYVRGVGMSRGWVGLGMGMGMSRGGVGMSAGEYVRGWVCLEVGTHHSRLLINSGGYHTYSWQAGGMHPTKKLSCANVFYKCVYMCMLIFVFFSSILYNHIYAHVQLNLNGVQMLYHTVYTREVFL